MNTATPLFEQALQAHHLAQLTVAHDLYEQVGVSDPQHAQALHLRGVICLQWGQQEIGIELIVRALQLQPANPKAHFNLANAYLTQQRYDDALDHFDQALRHQPEYVQALLGQAQALRQSERPYSAMASLARTLQLQPQALEAHLELAIAHAQLAQFGPARLRLAQLAQQAPGHAAIMQALQEVELLYQTHSQLIRPFLGASLTPPQPTQLALMGILAHSRQQYEAAIALFNASLDLDPRQAKVCSQKGLSHLGLGQYYGAIESFDRATALDPSLSEAWHNAGSALCELQHYPAAITQFREAVRTSEDKTLSLFMQLTAQLNICDWTDFNDIQRQVIAQIKRGNCPMQPLHVLAICGEPEVQLQAAQAHYKDTQGHVIATPLKSRSDRDARLRIGYFSRDFREHAVAYLTAELFDLHDRRQFEVIAFNFGEPTNDLMQDRLRQSFDQFHDVAHLDDGQIVQLARSLQIDLAVDLAGYTADNRSGIFARRVAPVQINYLGFPGTLGHPQIDYIIGDPLVTPDSLHSSYSEKVISLPCFQVNDRQRSISDRVFTRAELGIPIGHFVFCCFNSSYKITPAMFNTWLRILHACPASSLLLVKYHDQTEINLKQHASDQGLDPKRLIFFPKVPTPDYLARFRVADLFLDSSPFNAGTTASDALWAGLPVLTLAGQTFAGRMAASLLHAVGLPELVADDVHGYEQLAIRLATTPGELVQIRDRLATQRLRTLLFDTPVFVSRYEAALLLAHQRQHQGLPPQAIDMSHTMTKP
jgi:predicted O-linked N-acetylglucosamine transferase (SPINDLY family)